MNVTDKKTGKQFSPLEKYMYEVAQEMGLSLRSNRNKKDDKEKKR